MRDILITCVVFGLLPFIFKRPWYGVLLWSWLGYMNPHRLAYGFAYNFPFALIVGLVTMAAFVISREEKKIPWTRETILLLIFIGWILFTNFFAFYPDYAWQQWDKIWKIQLMVFITAILINERQRIDWLVWVIALSIGFYGIKGGIFTIAHGGSYRVQGPGGSFIEGNNELALALIMVAPLIRYLHLQATRKWVKIGLASALVLTIISAIGSQSRGALLAALSMGLFLWLKSRNKATTGFYGLIAILIIAAVMPQAWYDRMNTIQTYQQDASALGRINAWYTAVAVAKDRITGGGLDMFKPQTFRRYAPDPTDVHDVHSIYFEVLGEQGFIGLSMFLLLGLFTWLSANRIIRTCKNDPERKWAADLAAMIQVGLIGYATGGAFLGLAFFDLPYHFIILIVVTGRVAGVFGKKENPLIPKMPQNNLEIASKRGSNLQKSA